MGDMTEVIAARSDQLNAVDLVGGPMTITITRADVKKGQEQPVTVHFEGDEGKPWKPSKTASRIMAALWGPNSDTYSGRSLTLFRDPTVQWGGKEVGGILISHMSHIGETQELNLIVRRGVMKLHRIEPLAGAPLQADDGSRATADDLIRRARACDGPDALNSLALKDGIIKRRDWLREIAPDLADLVDDAFRLAQPTTVETGADTLTNDNPNASEGRDDSDMGEAHVDETPAWRAAVDEHIAAVKAAGTVIDLKGAINRFEDTRRALPDEAIAEVDEAEQEAAGRLNQLAAG